MRASKANLDVGDKPLLGYLLDQVRWPGPTILAMGARFAPVR
jgi:hypothetical protein